MRVTPDCDSISSFDICSVAGVQVYPDVAFDGTNYMVIWSDLRVPNNITVYAARVTQTGAVLDPTGIQVGPANGTFQNVPSIRFIGDKHLVVWGHLSAPFGITGRMINLDGSLGDTIHIANTSAEVHGTAIAYDGNKMCVIWNEYPGILSGQLVSTTGALIGSPFIIADNAVTVGSGSICFSGSEYFVIYSRRPGAYMELWGRRYDASANPISSPFMIAEPTYDCADGYVVDGDEHYLCVWSRLVYPADIYGNLDVEVGIEDDRTVMPDERPRTTTVVSGPLILPSGKTCKVFDIAGREVNITDPAPGIYFVHVEGAVVQKIIKVR